MKKWTRVELIIFTIYFFCFIFFFFLIFYFIYFLASLRYCHSLYFAVFFFFCFYNHLLFLLSMRSLSLSLTFRRRLSFLSLLLNVLDVYYLFSIFCIWPFIVVAGACSWLLYYRGHCWTFVWLVFVSFWFEEFFRFYSFLFAVLSFGSPRFYLSIA